MRYWLRAPHYSIRLSSNKELNGLLETALKETNFYYDKTAEELIIKPCIVNEDSLKTHLAIWLSDLEYKEYTKHYYDGTFEKIKIKKGK